ncbi:hypothetical protein ACEQ8H_008924 [Pleosporales sp. CAS-2024a]
MPAFESKAPSPNDPDVDSIIQDFIAIATDNRDGDYAAYQVEVRKSFEHSIGRLRHVKKSESLDFWFAVALVGTHAHYQQTWDDFTAEGDAPSAIQTVLAVKTAEIRSCARLRQIRHILTTQGKWGADCYLRLHAVTPLALPPSGPSLQFVQELQKLAGLKAIDDVISNFPEALADRIARMRHSKSNKIRADAGERVVSATDLEDWIASLTSKTLSRTTYREPPAKLRHPRISRRSRQRSDSPASVELARRGRGTHQVQAEEHLEKQDDVEEEDETEGKEESEDDQDELQALSLPAFQSSPLVKDISEVAASEDEGSVAMEEASVLDTSINTEKSIRAPLNLEKSIRTPLNPEKSIRTPSLTDTERPARESLSEPPDPVTKRKRPKEKLVQGSPPSEPPTKRHCDETRVDSSLEIISARNITSAKEITSARTHPRGLDGQHDIVPETQKDLRPGKWLRTPTMDDLQQRLAPSSAEFHWYDAGNMAGSNAVPAKMSANKLASTRNVLVRLCLHEHWILIHFNIQDAKVYVYDSKRGHISAEEIRRKSRAIGAAIWQATGKADQYIAPWSLPEFVNVPQQPNDYDCGVCTIIAAVHVIAGTELPTVLSAKYTQLWRLALQALEGDEFRLQAVTSLCKALASCEQAHVSIIRQDLCTMTALATKLHDNYQQRKKQKYDSADIFESVIDRERSTIDACHNILLNHGEDRETLDRQRAILEKSWAKQQRRMNAGSSELETVVRNWSLFQDIVAQFGTMVDERSVSMYKRKEKGKEKDNEKANGQKTRSVEEIDDEKMRLEAELETLRLQAEVMKKQLELRKLEEEIKAAKEKKRE